MVIDYLASFPRNYEAEVVEERPEGNNVPIFYFSGPLKKWGRDELLVSVRPAESRQWLGIFAFGGGPITALSSSPEVNTLCVVSRGAGYLVRADKPQVWKEIDELFPITDFRPIPNRGIIVLADYTTIGAYGANGLIWQTERISFDGINITSIGPDYIEGEAWDPTMRERPKFRVDLRTGEHEGGSNPDKYIPI